MTRLTRLYHIAKSNGLNRTDTFCYLAKNMPDMPAERVYDWLLDQEEE